MNKRPPYKILFISHEASHSGAPIVLLRFLRYFIANTVWEIDCVLFKPGELRAEFEEIGTVYHFHSIWSTLRDGLRKFSKGASSDRRTKSILCCFDILERLLSFPIWLRDNLLKKKLSRRNYDLIYSNTIVNGPVLDILSELNCPVITHVHELEYAILQAKDSLESVFAHTTHYIAVSEAVRENLVAKHNLPKEKIEIIHGCIATDYKISPTDRTTIREQLGIPQNAFVVGGVGGIHWRKGTDIFVYLADAVQRMNENNSSAGEKIHFIWVGAGDSVFQEALSLEIEKLGLAAQIHFVGRKENPLLYFAAMDVFVLTSREDPYPLVCLEAASIGLPIIAFDKAGGMPEFIGNDSGFVIPYLNIEKMAETILMLQKDSELLYKLGNNAQKKAVSCHDVAVIAPQIMDTIERCAKTR